jgi:aspartate aminotransferase
MKTTSVLVRDLEPSATAELVEKTSVLRRQGLDVISFGAGEPDFDTPAHIVDAAFHSLQDGFTHYVSSRGISELRNTISAYLLKQNGISVHPDTEIIVTTGSKMAIYLCLVGLLNPDDQVLILEPAWVSYDPMVRLAGGRPVHVPLDWRNGFAIEQSAIDPHVSAHTKAIIVNSPSNPTGHVLSLEELKVIERVAIEHDLFVISDEIYDRIVYDTACISPAKLPGLTARTLTTNGFSKAYAMTGWRLGYVAGSERLIAQILRVQQHVVTCATSFVQAAGVAALDGPQEPVEAMIGEYRRRRDLIVHGLNDFPGVTCTMPTGAFYAFPRFEGLNLSSQELAARLLDEHLVVTTPGSAFGAAGEGHLRLSYACATEDIEVGLKRIGEFLA